MILGTGAPVLFHRREKPFMFQLDTPGRTEVSGSVCVWQVEAVFLFFFFFADLFLAAIYTHTQFPHI